MNLFELFETFALTESPHERRIAEEEILEHFVNMLNERTMEMLRSLGLVNRQLSYSQLYNFEYRQYLSAILRGFRGRIQEFLGREPPPTAQELAYKLSWEVERIRATEDRHMNQTGIINAYIFYQSVRPGLIITKNWRANIHLQSTCQSCRWLHNQPPIPINQPFLIHGQEWVGQDGEPNVYNYIDRQVSIAHPNCRCWIEIEIFQRLEDGTRERIGIIKLEPTTEMIKLIEECGCCAKGESHVTNRAF